MKKVIISFFVFLLMFGTGCFSKENHPLKHSSPISGWSIYCTYPSVPGDDFIYYSELILLTGDIDGGVLLWDAEKGGILQDYRDVILNELKSAEKDSLFSEPKTVDKLRMSPDKRYFAYSVVYSPEERESSFVIIYVRETLSGKLIGKWETCFFGKEVILSFDFCYKRTGGINVLEIYTKSGDMTNREFYAVTNTSLEKLPEVQHIFSPPQSGIFACYSPDDSGHDANSISKGIRWCAVERAYQKFYMQVLVKEGNPKRSPAEDPRYIKIIENIVIPADWEEDSVSRAYPKPLKQSKNYYPLSLPGFGKRLKSRNRY